MGRISPSVLKQYLLQILHKQKFGYNPNRNCRWRGVIVGIDYYELLLFALYHIHLLCMEDKICCLSLCKGVFQ